MKKECRRAVIAGNWKMNNTPSATTAMINKLAPLTEGKNGCDIVLCVPFVDIYNAVEAAKGTNIKIGAQNVHFEKNGAFTGEISADMLTECGIEYVIIGHSERRQYFAETDVTVNLRTKAALDAGMTAIVCVGETLYERKHDRTEKLVRMQTSAALFGVSAEQLKKVIIAYEPVWAIGTGETATPEQADEVCGIIRDEVAKLYGAGAAEALTIQYGGSMNASNAEELLGKVNVDGGLIGGASLKPDDFAVIVNAAQK